MNCYRWAQRWFAVVMLAGALLAGGIALAAEEKQAGKNAPGAAAAAQQPVGDIDWNRAQQLYNKSRKGETLTDEESAYLQRAIQARKQGAGKGAGKGGQQQSANKGGGLPTPPPATLHTGLVPLDEMSATDKYKGEDGGLYGGGQNVPPAEHQKAAEKELAKIVPLDANGKPAADGKIVFASMGMSNTTMEFSVFKELADKDPAKSPQVVVVDLAQGGRDAARWTDAADPTWKTAEERWQAAGVSPQQVQVIWLKQARIAPSKLGDYPKHADEMAGHVVASLNLAKQKFPNLRIVYLSNRIYAGYATTGLNPEPYAYESAFVVRKLIRDQIAGEPKLNYDGAKGEVKSPLLLWGPNLWADGITPRKSDGLVWVREDLIEKDGTHPSVASGRAKVAGLLLNFCKTDPNAKGWFCKK
jgi:hypothetical protein